MSTSLSIGDYIALGNLTFEWAESYDQQDWARLRECLAPAIRLDFRALHGELKESVTPDEYIAIHSSPKVIGDPAVKTQHLFGASRWTVEADGSVSGAHQLQVKHQRYADASLKEVFNKGHAHGVVHQTYRKFGDSWKITGNRPTVDWSEYDLFGTMNPDVAKKA